MSARRRRMERGLLLVMNVFVRHALKLISPVKLVAARPPLNWFKAIRFTLSYSLGLIRSKAAVCEWTRCSGLITPILEKGPALKARAVKPSKWQTLNYCCWLQSIMTISFPTQSPVRVKMYVIKRQFALFLQHFRLKFDKTAGLISLLLWMLVIFHDVIWVFFFNSDGILFFWESLNDHKSESWDQLLYSSPAGTSHHRFVQLPVSLCASAAGL